VARLLHYSAQSIVGKQIYTRTAECAVEIKPHGLWVSVEGPDDWKSWCEAEAWGLDHLRAVAEIVVRPDAAILRLSCPAEIDRFHAEFTAPLYPGERSGFGVDWRRVAETYSGIVIAPYQWSRRLDGNARWYYAWDCASGCIWDASAIAEIRQAEIRRAEAEPR